MVQVPGVVAPSDAGPANDRVEVRGDQPVDSEAITRDAIAREAAGLGELDPALAKARAIAPPTSTRAADRSGVAPPSAETERAVADPLSSAMPPSAWESPESRRTRQAVLVGTVAIASLVLAGTLFTLFVRQRIPQNRTSNEASDTDSSALPDAPSIIDPEASVAVDPPTNPPNPESGTAPVDGGSAVTSGPEPSEAPNATTVAGTPAQMPSTDASATDDRSSTDVASSVPPPPEPGSRVTGAPSDPPDAGQPPPVNQAVAQGLADLPPELRAFAPLINLGSSGFDNQVAQPSVPPRALPPALKPPQDRGQHPPPLQSEPIGRRGDIKLTGLQIVEVPWVDALRVVEQLIGAPISIDYESLDAAGIDLRQRVSAQPTRTTVLAGLQTLLDSVDAEVLEQPEGFLVVRATPRRLEQVASRWDVSDLANDDAQRSALLELVNSLLIGFDDETPVGWADDGSTLSLSSDPLRRWQLTLLLEAIRQGRGLPPRESSPSLHRWLASKAAADAALALPADPVALPAQPMAASELLGRLVGPDASVVIDWLPCWEHGLTPRDPLLPWKSGLSRDEIVTEALQPYALRLVPRGEGLWALTSPEAYALEPQWVTAPLKIDPPIAMKRLGDALAAAPPSGTWAVAHDPQGQLLVARLPRYLANQLNSLIAP
jgi:hypothetical protein